MYAVKASVILVAPQTSFYKSVLIKCAKQERYGGQKTAFKSLKGRKKKHREKSEEKLLAPRF